MVEQQDGWGGPTTNYTYMKKDNTGLYILGENDEKVNSLMSNLSKKGLFKLNQHELDNIKKDFEAVKINDEETKSIIKQIDKKHKFIIDPHTATGFGAAKKVKNLENIVVLGTAHPYKFNETIKLVTGKTLKAPIQLKIQVDKEEKFDIIENSNTQIKKYILSKIK